MTAPWRHLAACRTAPDPELFFPNTSGMPTPQQMAPALAYCLRCPVTVECERDANESGAQHGIWAGKFRSPEHLRNERRRAARAVTP